MTTLDELTAALDIEATLTVVGSTDPSMAYRAHLVPATGSWLVNRAGHAHDGVAGVLRPGPGSMWTVTVAPSLSGCQASDCQRTVAVTTDLVEGIRRVHEHWRGQS